MKQFSCGAIVPGCGAVFAADTEADVLTEVAAHARDAHGLDPVPPDLVEQVRSLITDA